ncbi:MAG: response regulator [candidate division Zixibacteria bacterium]|nr:response regulator [candidate division Zixibacteria bacterium]
MLERRLLVVDDELFVRELLQEFFAKLNYAVDIARSGADAMELLRENLYEVALVDLKMSEMDGIELLRQIRQTDENLQVVLMTGYPTVDSAISALRQDAYDYVIKPFRLSELETIVRNAIRDRQLGLEIKLLRDRVSQMEEKLTEENVTRPERAISPGRRFSVRGLASRGSEDWTESAISFSGNFRKE